MNTILIIRETYAKWEQTYKTEYLPEELDEALATWTPAERAALEAGQKVTRKDNIGTYEYVNATALAMATLNGATALPKA